VELGTACCLQVKACGNFIELHYKVIKACLSSSIFSIFVNIIFPPVNMNIYSRPVKSTLLPLQLLEYGIMQCLVFRPNFVLTGFILKGQVCKKSYGASFGCRKTAHPNYVMA
jgi:hypothetical protein